MKCQICKIFYDDAEQTTICPHGRIASKEVLKMKDIALTLLGKDVCFAHMPEKVYRVQSISYDGMITISGMSGEFAPYLFTIKET